MGGDGVGIGVVFGWLNEVGVCSPWVWDLLAVGLLPWVWVLLVVGLFFFFFGWWVLLTVMLFSGGGVGNGLWSRFVFTVVAGMWCRLVSSSIVMVDCSTGARGWV